MDVEPSKFDMLHRLKTKHAFGVDTNVLIIGGQYVGMLLRFTPNYEFRGNRECV